MKRLLLAGLLIVWALAQTYGPVLAQITPRITGGGSGGGGGGGTPGGSPTDIQYNKAGAFAGSPCLTFDDVTNTATIGCGGVANGSIVLPNITNTNLVTIRSGVTSVASLVFTLPTADGSANQLIRTDGSGNLSFGGVTWSQITSRPWKCAIITGDPGAASPVLANDNDTPVGCQNDTGATVTIATVAAWADAGTPTVTPILTAGSATSILTGACTAGTAAWAACTVNGSPTLNSFSGTGATCSSTPCTIDANITTAGGTAKYVVVKITGTY